MTNIILLTKAIIKSAVIQWLEWLISIVEEAVELAYNYYSCVIRGKQMQCKVEFQPKGLWLDCKTLELS